MSNHDWTDITLKTPPEKKGRHAYFVFNTISCEVEVAEWNGNKFFRCGNRQAVNVSHWMMRPSLPAGVKGSRRITLRWMGYTPENLKKLRSQYNLSQQQVADILNMKTAESVSRWESPTDSKRHNDMPLSKWEKLLRHVSKFKPL